MKKNTPIWIITVANIILLSLALWGTDFLIYKKFKDAREQGTTYSYKEHYKTGFSHNSLIFYKKSKNTKDIFRNPQNEDKTNKKSILFFGCSYAFGFGVKEKDTLPSKIAFATDRVVYNFSLCACGIQHMLYYIQSPWLPEQIKQTPEHIIYIYIPSHLERLQANIFPQPIHSNGKNLKYKIQKNSLKLEEQTFGLLEKTFIFKSILYQLDLKRDNTSQKNKDYNSELAIKIFTESKKELQKKYPNINFVILKYEVEDAFEEQYEKEDMWKKLEENGFKIIKTSDLIGRKFKYASEDTTFDQYHPSEKAFESLVQPLIKELNL